MRVRLITLTLLDGVIDDTHVVVLEQHLVLVR